MAQDCKQALAALPANYSAPQGNLSVSCYSKSAVVLFISTPTSAWFINFFIWFIRVSTGLALCFLFTLLG